MPTVSYLSDFYWTVFLLFWKFWNMFSFSNRVYILFPSFKNQYFEIDIYPFWNDKAIMEIELRDENQEYVLPSNITVIKEVTDDDEYKNSSLAKKF